jgi:hypothetical protein
MLKWLRGLFSSKPAAQKEPPWVADVAAAMAAQGRGDFKTAIPPFVEGRGGGRDA